MHGLLQGSGRPFESPRWHCRVVAAVSFVVRCVPGTIGACSFTTKKRDPTVIAQICSETTGVAAKPSLAGPVCRASIDRVTGNP
ncbi:hypothetical protein SF06_00760 [Pseudomonas flexibilis]|nr:hypothetical protein SF06_00760 [Pseudomonas flexibilis]